MERYKTKTVKVGLAFFLTILFFINLTGCGTAPAEAENTVKSQSSQEEADSGNIIYCNIPEVDEALENIPEGERRDLIWEYWFTPTETELTVTDGSVDLSETAEERELRKTSQLERIQMLLDLPLEELRTKVADCRVKNEAMVKSEKEKIQQLQEEMEDDNV